MMHARLDEKHYPSSFWQYLETLVNSCEVIIDRPKNTPHPRYPELIYPLDYGYLQGTQAMDGDGIDLWRGSSSCSELVGLAVSVDLEKKDVEIKLLLGCNEEEIGLVMDFLNGYNMSAWFVER